ncbi:MAG: hypothetical protein ABI866_00310 [Dokdonella sp.]
MKILKNLTAVLALCAAAFCGAAVAADWDLDTSFGNQGRQTVPFDAGGTNTDYIVKILRYPDNLNGLYVAVGSASLANGRAGIALTRFLANGAIDSSFGTNGKVLKDACMTQVTNAAFDSFYRIVVVGTTSCSGNSTTDAAVVRFTSQGADDTSFAGDGGVGIKFRPAFDVNDRGGAVLVLADDSLLVGGNADGNSAYIQKVSASGVVSALSPAQTNPVAYVRKVLDVLPGPFNSSYWLVSNVDQASNYPGDIWKINNATLGNDTTFSSLDGEQSIGVPVAGTCGTDAVHTLSTLVRFGTRIYAFGHTTSSISSSFAVGLSETDGTGHTYRCLDQAGVAVNFTTFAAVGSGDAGGSIYLAGSCGVPENFCLWRTVRADASSTSFIPDSSFNGGVPVTVSFSAETGRSPQSDAFSMVRHGNKTVLAGLRVYNGATGDFDFALARFGTDIIFANGFEN